MTKDRYPSAVEQAKAKLSGVDNHPADKHRDPLNAVLADDRATSKAKLKHIGGSNHDRFNLDTANAVLQACWVTSSEQRQDLVASLGHALAAIGPSDELEGMMAAQMVAAHQASMECYRRAMLPEQTTEARDMNLKFATKASQTYAALLDTLNRHRGKGNQKVVVEHVHRHVHVHDDGRQTVIDHVENSDSGGGASPQNPGKPHAPRLAHAPQDCPPVWREDPEREAVPRAGHGERTMSDARRPKPKR